MRKLRVTTFALAGLLSSIVTAPAHADSQKSGLVCRFTSISDPSRHAGAQTGEVDAGPVTIVDDTNPTVLHEGHIECAIHVGLANMQNAAPDDAVVAGPRTQAVVDLPPTQLSFSAGPGDDVYLCIRLVTDEGTWYGDFGANDLTDPTPEWSTSPATNCGLAISDGTVVVDAYIYPDPPIL